VTEKSDSPQTDSSSRPVSNPVESGSALVLKRADQVGIAALLLICAVVFGVYAVRLANRGDGLEIIGRGAAAAPTLHENLQDREHAGPHAGPDAEPHANVRVIYQMDLNQATWPELATLPGIGEVTAKSIVEYRDRQGPFQKLDELLQVRGVGPKTLDQVTPYLIVETMDGD